MLTLLDLTTVSSRKPKRARLQDQKDIESDTQAKKKQLLSLNCVKLLIPSLDKVFRYFYCKFTLN